MDDDLRPSRRIQREARVATFDRVQALQAAGKTLRNITQTTGVGRPTVRQWVRSGHLADRAVATPTTRSPRYFKDHLSQRWGAGCIDGDQLLHEIRLLGYTGSYSNLQRFLAEWRRAMREQPTGPEPLGDESRVIDPTTGWQISPIMAVYLCMRPRGTLTAVQAAKVRALKQSSPSFTAMRRLAMRFRGILRSGRPDKLDQWLREASRCDLQAIHRHVGTASHDLAALRNASTERWSNGPVEGQINRLKTLKRAMYGRAGVELLRARLTPFL